MFLGRFFEYLVLGRGGLGRFGDFIKVVMLWGWNEFWVYGGGGVMVVLKGVD